MRLILCRIAAIANMAAGWNHEEDILALVRSLRAAADRLYRVCEQRAAMRIHRGSSHER
jgi:hypothetical protein